MVIGGYLAFIIFVMGTILNAQDFTDEEKQQFFQEILKAHNEYRKIHGSKPLNLDQNMCRIAKQRVDEWIAKKPNTLSKEYGANYYSIRFNDNSELDSGMIVQQWYKYENGYDYLEKLSSPNLTDPFTQLVWNSTEKIGVGILMKKGIFSLVVIYSPAGNQPGQYVSNVTNPRELAKQKAELRNTTDE